MDDYLFSTIRETPFSKNIYYLPVEKRVFQDIHMEMKKLDGEQIHFGDSVVRVNNVLHFRRV
jgi:hypothetical protein